jgi:nitrite reductase/ring-hydroxylating ferredoxin subunit
MCATHGALFEIEDGKCVYGPCLGRSLAPIRIRVEGGNVLLDE